MAPAEPPEPIPWNLPFQAATGGSQTSKPIWESLVGVATPIARQKGTAMVVVPMVPPWGRYSALWITVSAATLWPDNFAQLAASPGAISGPAAWPLLAARSGRKAQ